MFEHLLYNVGRFCLSVCLSVCLYVCQTINFESLDVGSSYKCFTSVISLCYYMCLVGCCQCRLNSALESCRSGLFTGVIVLAVYVSQINDWLICISGIASGNTDQFRIWRSSAKVNVTGAENVQNPYSCNVTLIANSGSIKDRANAYSMRHRSRIRYLSKKNSRTLTNFPKLKKFVQKFVEFPIGRGLPVE